jgi:hypothetical protein
MDAHPLVTLTHAWTHYLVDDLSLQDTPSIPAARATLTSNSALAWRETWGLQKDIEAGQKDRGLVLQVQKAGDLI